MGKRCGGYVQVSDTWEHKIRDATPGIWGCEDWAHGDRKVFYIIFENRDKLEFIQFKISFKTSNN